MNRVNFPEHSPALSPGSLNSSEFTQHPQRHASSPGLVQIAHIANRQTPSPPILDIDNTQILNQQIMTKITTNQHSNSNVKSSQQSGNASLTVNTMNNDGEEINTKELAQRISAELKRYSIPQAIFAQRVLCRSQGTLSDLLRNPKPWSKLKSGRETFRRMFKWLQEPEYQRMSALRLAGMFKKTKFNYP